MQIGFLARTLRLPLLLLAMLVIGSPAWGQTNAQSKPDKEQAKDAAKATKEAVKEAEKAIKQGDIDQLKTILQANPGLVYSSEKQSVVGAMAAATVLAPVAGGNAAPLVVAAGSGVKLLHSAAYYGQKDAVDILLANGANVNAADGLGFTPLHEAAMNGYPEVVKVLLADGANKNARCINGDTPLKVALWSRATGTRAGGRSRAQLRADLDAVVALLQ